VRAEFNRLNDTNIIYRVDSPDKDAIEQAGRFVYLNARCFNGLYRENAKGEMNSPYAKDLKGMKRICNKENILALHDYFSMQKICLSHGDYENSLLYLKLHSEIANSPVFFFLDPPYYPLTETASFTSYTSGPWTDSDFIRLRIFVDEINKNGWKFLLCNHSVPFIKALFKGYYHVDHMVSRSVSRNAQDRKPVMEILVANYEIKQTRQVKVI
jgi:DNA adenine methylase